MLVHPLYAWRVVGPVVEGLAAEVVVVVVVVVDALVVVVVVWTAELLEEVGAAPYLYTVKRFPPPQIVWASPAQAILQVEASEARVPPFEKAFPQ